MDIIIPILLMILSGIFVLSVIIGGFELVMYMDRKGMLNPDKDNNGTTKS